MKFQILVVVLLCALGTLRADIIGVRKEALKKIEHMAEHIIKVGNDTNAKLKYKPFRINEFFNLIWTQSLMSKEGTIEDMNIEVKLLYRRADCMNCKISVYNCLANAANDAEHSLRKIHEIFEKQVNTMFIQYSTQQSKEIEKWVKDITVDEEDYRKKYGETAFKISSSSTESKIQEAVKAFENTTKTFEEKIVKIDKDMDKNQVLFLNNLQVSLSDYRSNLGSEKATHMSKLKQCLTLKFLLL